MCHLNKALFHKKMLTSCYKLLCDCNDVRRWLKVARLWIEFRKSRVLTIVTRWGLAVALDEVVVMDGAMATEEDWA